MESENRSRIHTGIAVFGSRIFNLGLPDYTMTDADKLALAEEENKKLRLELSELEGKYLVLCGELDQVRGQLEDEIANSNWRAGRW